VHLFIVCKDNELWLQIFPVLTDFMSEL
jgi:hypothetical protein